MGILWDKHSWKQILWPENTTQNNYEHKKTTRNWGGQSWYPWISIFPTSRLPPRWAILRWGILRVFEFLKLSLTRSQIKALDNLHNIPNFTLTWYHDIVAIVKLVTITMLKLKDTFWSNKSFQKSTVWNNWWGNRVNNQCFTMIEEEKLAGLPVHKRNTEHVFVNTSLQHTYILETNAYAYTF